MPAKKSTAKSKKQPIRSSATTPKKTSSTKKAPTATPPQPVDQTDDGLQVFKAPEPDTPANETSAPLINIRPMPLPASQSVATAKTTDSLSAVNQTTAPDADAPVIPEESIEQVIAASPASTIPPQASEPTIPIQKSTMKEPTHPRHPKAPSSTPLPVDQQSKLTQPPAVPGLPRMPYITAEQYEHGKSLRKPSARRLPWDFDFSPTLPRLRLLAYLPTIRSLKRQIHQALAKIPAKVAIGIVVLAAVLVAGFGLYRHFAHPKPQTTVGQTGQISKTATGQPKLTHGNPPYSTIIPAGKTIQQLGGWTRISPPNRNPVYAYTDKIGNIEIDVSEQPLPASFTHDTGSQVANLAQNFNANQKITAGDTTVYLGTASNGQQSVILTKANLLILIKSADQISTDQWAAYVSSLN